jgi:acetyl esterase/lipase
MSTALRRALLAAVCLTPALALAQVAPQSPASPSGNSVRGTAQTAPPTSASGPIQSNDTRPNQNQLNQGQVRSGDGSQSSQTAPVQPSPAQPAPAPRSSNEAPGAPQTTQSIAPAGNPNAHQDMDMAKVISTWESLGPKPIESLTPTEARRQPTVADAAKKIVKDEKRDVDPRAGLDITNRRFADMGDLRLRWYVPEKAARNAGANAGNGAGLPIIVFFRGGGWVIADLDTYDATPAALARKTGAAVVSVDYPMAPEKRFPAAHDEAMEAYRYVLRNAGGWGYDANRVAIVGESAGGNLAMNVAIGAREANLTRPVAVVAVYPVAATADDTPSKKGQAAAKPLNTPMLGWFFSHVLASPEQKQDPRLNLVAANLANLPPVTIIGAEIDPLRSEGDMLADKLKAAGNSVTHKVYNGVTHEFFGMDAVVAKAAEAQVLAAQQLQQAFGAR